jgi:DNA polymerase-3 subunit delta
MTTLIPEIDKLAAFASSDRVTKREIDAAASRIPEADVFEMADRLSSRDFDAAAKLLSGLLQMREHPIKILAMIGQQMRRLYAARLSIDEGLGKAYVADVCSIKYDFIANKLLTGAKGFSLEQLGSFVALCAEYDYAMKSSAADGAELLKELLIDMALGAKK